MNKVFCSIADDKVIKGKLKTLNLDKKKKIGTDVFRDSMFT